MLIYKYTKYNISFKKMEYIIDRQWKWVDCNLVIKRIPQKDYHEGVYESLEAEVQLISEEPDIQNFQVDIVMEKGFEFEEGKGFIWHKSWYIPEINIKLPLKVIKMIREEGHIKKMYCEILSAYPFKKDDHYYLEEVRLDGDTIKQFNKKGELTFSNIKFSQTSFNKSRNKFSIILAIYTVLKRNEKSIVKSYISSSIHVDSRKEARKKISANTFIQDEISVHKFQNPLQGSEKIVTANYKYEDILTIPGFIKYYTAANIRFKIKHPYYIGYHFYHVFDVYYNSQEATDPVNVLELIYQNELKQSDRAKVKPKPKKDIFNDNKEILKKSCPKILLFLIKNTPKQCYIVKDQNQQISMERIQFNKENPISELNAEKNVPEVKREQQPFEIIKKHEQKAFNFQIPPQDPERSQNNPLFWPQANLLPSVSQNQSGQNQEKNNLLKGQKLLQKDPAQKQNSDKNQKKQIVVKQENVVITSNTKGNKQLKNEEQAIKKIYSIFQSWKFNFIHLKKSDGGLTVLNKKWIPIRKEELFQAFKTYKQMAPKHLQQKPINPNQNANSQTGANIGNTGGNSYLNYDLHQVIFIQKSKNAVKLQEKEGPSEYSQ